MSVMKIRKVTTLPSTYEGSTLYLVRSASDANLFDMYLSTSDGTSVRRIISKSDIATMITAAVSSFSTVEIVQNIAARNALVLSTNTQVLVLDAIGDPTVTSGAALYIYDHTTTIWHKVSEFESLDVVLDWSAIQNKPTSTVAQIDAAVSNSHTHANKAVLDLLSVNAGNLYYNAQPIRAFLEEETW